MNSALKHQPLIAEILPGFLVFGLFAVSYGITHPVIQKLIASNGIEALIGSGLVLLGSWIVGTTLDALRNLLEYIWDEKWPQWPINWDFFFQGETQKVHQLEEFYYAHYTLDANFAIGIPIFIFFQILLFSLFPAHPPLYVFNWWIQLLLIVAFGIFFLDAKSLRQEIRKLTNHSDNGSTPPAHHGVYTRLQPSPTHGIGVFAIRHIPKGTMIFSNDNSEMVWVDKSDINKIDPEVKKLYDDFCVIKQDKYGCPANFNALTVSWYLNESKKGSNVRCVDDYDFMALRDIEQGEELLVDYATYSEYPKTS